MGFFLLGQASIEGFGVGIFGAPGQSGIQVQGLGLNRRGQFQGLLGRGRFTAKLGQEVGGRQPAFKFGRGVGEQAGQFGCVTGFLGVEAVHMG